MLGKHGKHLLNAIKYSLKGLGTAIRKEAAFQQEIIVLFVVIPLGLLLGKTGVERALLIGSWLFVMVIELINSAIEATVDRVGFEHHKLSGRAKDFGSASVFLSILLAVVVWALILLS
ncbi:MAG: diacylglycerol kinase [bacterium]